MLWAAFKTVLASNGSVSNSSQTVRVVVPGFLAKVASSNAVDGKGGGTYFGDANTPRKEAASDSALMPPLPRELCEDTQPSTKTGQFQTPPPSTRSNGRFTLNL